MTTDTRRWDRVSRRVRLAGFGLAAAVLAGVVATCDGGNGELAGPPDPAVPVPASVTVTPDTVSLDALGDTAALAARVLDQNGAELAGATVSWSSGDASVATVSAVGLVTAAGNGTAVVSARSGSAAGQARVVVEQRIASLSVEADSVFFDALGDTASLVAEARDSNGAAVSGAAVSWSSGDESVVTVSSTGLVTTVDNGSAVLTASVDGFADQVLAVVEQRVASVVVGPDSVRFNSLGDTAALVAEVLDSNGAVVSGAAVSWSSRDESIATVSATGVVTAEGNGAVAVAASAEGVTGEARVVVEQRAASVVVGPASLMFDALGDSAKLVAETRDANGAAVSDAAVSWASGDESVAKVSAAGVVTAAGNGAASITASVDGAEGQARVVVQQRVASVVVAPGSLSFDALGDTARLVAEARDANGAAVADAAVTWSSADESVAAVSGSGLVTSAGNGTVAVTASAGEATGHAEVVVAQRIAAVVVTPDPLTFDALGDTASLAAEVLDANGAVVSGAAVSWSSVNESVVTVSGAGLVTAVANGAAAVTASAGEATDEAQVVVSQRIASVVVAPDPLRLDALGDTARLVAEARDANGAQVAGVAVSWSSSDESVATVSADGLVTAVSAGVAVVTASAGNAEGGAAGQARVAVGQRIASVRVTPSPLRLDTPGDTASLVVEARDPNGAVVAGAVVSWSSGNESVATVSTAGLVTAVGRGTAVVTASAGDATGRAQVAVGRPIASVVVTPSPLRLGELGDTASLAAEAQDSVGGVVSGAVVSWRSGNESVATVSSSGLVTAVGTGTTVVTASVEGTEGQAQVVVGQRLSSVVVNPASLTFALPGDTAPMFAEARDLNGQVVSGAVVSWASEDETVATVSDRGPMAGMVTAVGRGSTVVTASARGATGRAQVVVEQRVAFVAVAPHELWFRALGDTALLVAKARDARGGEVPGVVVSWSSGDELVATVSDTGLVTAAGDGAAVITATAEGRQASASVDVTTGTHPDRAALVEFYSATNGDSWYQNTNWLTDAPIYEWHGVGWENGRVYHLILPNNGVTGTIPSALGNLSSLSWLDLGDNALTGPIPPELGNLSDLNDLRLYDNLLAGSIPPELGNLSKLSGLSLAYNALTGPIPPELGNLSDLNFLELYDNLLTGSIPPELGSLSRLYILDLRWNDLAGTMPDEMTSLVDLRSLSVDNTVCAPQTPAFDRWLSGMNHNVIRCYVEPPDTTAAYVTQAVPTGGAFAAPLLAGETALLRVVVTGENPDSVGIPPVRATFYSGGAAVHTAEIPAQPNNPIRLWVDESSFDGTANAVIPVSVLTPGLEMVVEIDPAGTLGSSVDLVSRLPETGRTSLDVQSVDVFELTVIPFLWSADPDSTLLGLTSELGPDHELFALTRALLPIVDMEVTVHDPVWSSSNNAHDLLELVKAARLAEGGSGYWMGLLNEPTGASGVATISGQDSFSEPADWVVAHELGHNLSLFHAPCGGAGGPDPAYPYNNGRIGSWGWVPGTESFVTPAAFDVMSYCRNPVWISDYHFAKAFNYRDGAGVPIRSTVRVSDEQSLLLWGGERADGSVYLNPAFVVDAPRSLPEPDGEYRMVGEAEDGGVLFSRAFAMQEVADGDGGSSFAFALPVEPAWAAMLARITLTGGGSSATLGREGDEAAVLLRDPDTGQVRGLLLDVPVDSAAQAEWLAPLRTENLNVQISRGIPAVGVWQR